MLDVVRERVRERSPRVVILRALRLGDLICATPALRALRAALPNAQISLIGLPLAREFVRRCPSLDAFLEFPGYPGIADQTVQPERTVAFLQRMQAGQFDLAIQLHGSGVFSNPFTRLLGARSTVGFTRAEETDLGLDFAIPYPTHGHEIHRLLTLTRALGAPDQGDAPALSMLPEDEVDLRRQPQLAPLVVEGTPLIGVHPGAKVATRRWPPERFAAVADTLAAQYDANIVITGGADEWETCEIVRRQIHAAHAINLAGQTSLGALAALLTHLRLFITNDSGPAHVATAIGTSSVVIFGAAQAGDWAPLDTQRHRALSVPMPCRPCILLECPIGYRCLQAISVDAVVAQAQTLLAHHEQRTAIA